MSEEIRGYVQKLIFNAENDNFCVFSLLDYNEEKQIITANLKAPYEGDEVKVVGNYTKHKKFGEQFKATIIERIMPETVEGAILYIDRLEIKGLGSKSLERIKEYFGEELVDVLMNNPKRFLEVKKIRKSVKETLYQTLCGEGFLEEINRFLDKYSISTKWSKQLFDRYAEKTIQIIESNPYHLMEIIDNIPFYTVDRLAQQIGILPDNNLRIIAGINYILARLDDDGHTCLPVEELIEQTDSLLCGYAEEVAFAIEKMLVDGNLHLSEFEGIQYIYPYDLYLAEVNSVWRTNEFIDDGPIHLIQKIDSFIYNFENEEDFKLGDEQKNALNIALTNKISVITGGPGTGKTTVIKGLVQAYQKNDIQRIVLCAPTGRAAKRLSEATGIEATTIHRLLMPVGTDSYEFIKNQNEPLETDVIIVDEASMLNIQLYDSLTQAIPDGAILVLVGDVDQLPPIGPGFVLRDLIDSKEIAVAKLDKVYRQKQGNSIIENAYLVNQGQMPNLTDENEFSFIAVNNMDDLVNKIAEEYDAAIERGENPLDIQVISPMRRRAVGSYELSKSLQAHVMSNIIYKTELEKIVIDCLDEQIKSVKVFGQELKVGDKIIQNINNYELDIYNGEIGIIYAITKKYIFVKFPDKEVKIPIIEAEGLSLAYAITVHKSQGSEYSTVIIPFIMAHGPMLQRNLLYTAITRAKEKVIIIGTEHAIEKAIQTVSGKNRYTLFKERLSGKIND